MSGLTIDESIRGGMAVPTVVKSEQDMEPDIPAALRHLKRKNAMDLAPMLGLPDA